MTPQRSRLLPEVKELLARYQSRTPKIEVEYLDPERNPARADALVKEFGVRVNTVVFRSGDRKKYVEEDKLADFDFAGAGMGGAPAHQGVQGRGGLHLRAPVGDRGRDSRASCSRPATARRRSTRASAAAAMRTSSRCSSATT